MRKIGKKIWILGMFTVFITVAMLFVSWLIYAAFADNYRGIKQQYYAVVSGQIIEDIENSVKNGKRIESFYGIDTVLNDMQKLIGTDQVPINTAITDADGEVLYTSYAASGSRDVYNAMLAADAVRGHLTLDNGGESYRVVNSGEYEVMIQPIRGAEQTRIGYLALFYRSADIEAELIPQKQRSDFAAMMCAGITILFLIVYFLLLPRKIAEELEGGSEAEGIGHKIRRNRLMFLVPIAAIMAGLLAQCAVSYDEYRLRYREVMLESAEGISRYIGSIVNELNEKGVPYERMDGLAEYLAGKVEESPLLWNVSVVNVYADTADILGNTGEYSISFPIRAGETSSNMHINVEISREYIDKNMTDMLLVFLVTFAVALIMIYELLKLPDGIFTRISKSFKASRKTQAGLVAPAARLSAFAAYTGMYVGLPFSSVLIKQWNQSTFGLSVTFLSSLPMTSELLATVLCSLLLLPVYRRTNVKAVLTVSSLITAAANILCFFADSPALLILYRFISGTGFAGIKYSLNTAVSEGSVTDADTTNNLAGLNAGLLGGITCGGTLGAVIAGAAGVRTSYLIAGIFMTAFLITVLALMPWNLISENMSGEQVRAEGEKKAGMISAILDPAILHYMLLAAIPLNFGLMFISAFFPSLVSSLGLPEVTTSYGYLINGLVGIYIGPQLLNALSKKISKAACVIAALLMGALSVLILNIPLPSAAVLMSVAVLGLFDGFGTPAASDYYVNLPAVRRMGANRGLSVLSVVGSVVQTFSPVLYSLILVSGSGGMGIAGLMFLLCAVLFGVTLKFVRKDKEIDRS